MKPENKNAQAFLLHHGIKARAKYYPAGSVRGWRFADSETKWTPALREKFTALGFTSYNGEPLHEYSGNGGVLCIFCRGHEELRTTAPVLTGPPAALVNKFVADTGPKPATDDDLARAEPFIEAARKTWAQRAGEYLRTRGDEGSCVLGAGISVPYLAPGCRNPRDRMLIDAPGGQGSLTWEDSVSEIVKFLQTQGGLPGAFYSCGRMD